MLRRSLIAATSLLALSACATSIAPRVSQLPKPGALIAGQGPQVTTAEPSGDWWRLYADPKLDSLVQEALEHNRDLAAAAANLAQVEASLSQARAAYFPSTTTSAGYTRGRLPADQVAPGADRNYDSYTASLGANYEIDLFGRVRNAVGAAKADRDAQAAAVDLERLTVASETARAYVEICAANAQIAVAQNTIELQSRTAGLTQTLLDNGRGSGLDVAGAQAAVATTRATLPPLQAQRDSATYRLAVLTGKPPEQADAAAAACAAIPQLSAPIPIGDGAGLLARRPDVRQADRQLAAAVSRGDVAAAGLYPSITLGGSVGESAGRTGDIGSNGFTFSVGPLISWSFPNLLVAKAQLAGAKAGADAALAHFDSVTLNALQDTETALSAYANELDRRTALTTASDQAAEASRLSQIRYNAGADTFLTLLDAQRTQAQAQAALAQSQAQVAEDQVTLFQALGGGWQPAS